MTRHDHLDQLRLYTPAEVSTLLGAAVSVSWIKTQARRDPSLTTRFTGRRTMLFTAEQVLLLRRRLTGPEAAPPLSTGTEATASAAACGPSQTGGAGTLAGPAPAATPRPFRSLRAAGR